MAVTAKRIKPCIRLVDRYVWRCFRRWISRRRRKPGKRENRGDNNKNRRLNHDQTGTAKKNYIQMSQRNNWGKIRTKNKQSLAKLKTNNCRAPKMWFIWSSLNCKQQHSGFQDEMFTDNPLGCGLCLPDRETSGSEWAYRTTNKTFRTFPKYHPSFQCFWNFRTKIIIWLTASGNR